VGKLFVLGMDLGTTTGVCKLFYDDSIETLITKHKPDLKERVCGVAGIIESHSSKECIGVCIEEPFSGQFSSVKALFPMIGAVVLECENQGLPWSFIHLSKLKAHATGKGNAKKHEMQEAAFQRWGQRLTEDEADACFAAAYAMDTGLFTNGL